MTLASERRTLAGRTRPIASMVLAVVLGWGSMARVVRAAEPDVETRTLARELALKGAEAFDRKDFWTALDRFNRAEALFRVPSIGVMRARSLVGLHRLLEALDAYEATRRMPIGQDPPAAFREAVDDAKVEGEELRTRIPHLIVHVRAAQGIPADLQVVLDGKPVPEALLDVERPVDPGMHEVIASAPGYMTSKRSAGVKEGDHAAVEIVLSRTPAAILSVSPVDEARSSDKSKPGSAAVWGWVAVGAGAVGLGVATITGVTALQKKSSLDSKCQPGCPASEADDIDSFRMNRTVSYVSLAFGAVSLGVGGYVLLTSGADSTKVAVGVGPGSAHLLGTF